jgi:hypothetical protein
MKKKALIRTVEPVEPLLHVVRGERIILDADLAGIYGVPTKRLSEQVGRNAERFPSDFLFQLTPPELASLRSQIATSNIGRGGRRYLPYAFTEHGAIMAANVLNSPQATQMSVFVDADFRDDLKALKSASPAVIKSLAKWLATVESAGDLGDSDKWIPALKETGLVLDDLQKVVKPALWMADLCARKHVPMADLVDDLAESGIVGKGAQRKATKQKLLALGSPLEPLLQKAEVKASPELPLLYVKSIKTRGHNPDCSRKTATHQRD